MGIYARKLYSKLLNEEANVCWRGILFVTPEYHMYSVVLVAYSHLILRFRRSVRHSSSIYHLIFPYLFLFVLCVVFLLV